MKGPPVWQQPLRLLIGILWSAVYVPFLIQAEADAAGKANVYLVLRPQLKLWSFYFDCY